jgi:UDP-GlcNAc:undecaprenyl-phosphate GlcNAc-1-phosphate transferase
VVVSGVSPSVEAYAVVAAVTTLTTLALVPLVRRLAFRVGAVVRPDERRVHERPTPTLGGVAMVGGLLAGMAVAWRLDAFAEVFAGNTEPIGVVLAAVLMLSVGVLDDLREVSAPAKVAGIAVPATVLVLSGVSILVLRIPFQGTFVLSPDWSYLLSVLWVIGMANAINLIDGLDGLAAGIVAIASGTFFLYAVRLIDVGLLVEGNIGPLLAVIVLGMCLGFLPFNVHPARIFMGDGGALTLGLLLAAATMVVGGRTDHHRLMRLGHGHRRSVLILWAWTALLSGFVLYPTYTGKGDAFVPIGIAALGLALFTVLHPTLRRGGPESDVGLGEGAAAGARTEPAGRR